MWLKFSLAYIQFALNKLGHVSVIPRGLEGPLGPPKTALNLRPFLGIEKAWTKTKKAKKGILKSYKGVLIDL